MSFSETGMLPKDSLFIRVDRLLSRSGEWNGGVEERAKELAAKIGDQECLPGHLLKTNLPLLMGRLLAWIEKEAKFHAEWLLLKKRLKHTEEKLRARIAKARAKGKATSSLKLRLADVRKRLDWMRLGPRSRPGISEGETKPSLHSRWSPLRNMEELLMRDYRMIGLRGLNLKFERLAHEREHFGADIPKWARIENLPRLKRHECAKHLACILSQSPYTRMSPGAILRALQRHYPAK